jgi:hypothetical protein
MPLHPSEFWEKSERKKRDPQCRDGWKGICMALPARYTPESRRSDDSRNRFETGPEPASAVITFLLPGERQRNISRGVREESGRFQAGEAAFSRPAPEAEGVAWRERPECSVCPPQLHPDRALRTNVFLLADDMERFVFVMMASAPWASVVFAVCFRSALPNKGGPQNGCLH